LRLLDLQRISEEERRLSHLVVKKEEEKMEEQRKKIEAERMRSDVITEVHQEWIRLQNPNPNPNWRYIRSGSGYRSRESFPVLSRLHPLKEAAAYRSPISYSSMGMPSSLLRSVLRA